MVHIWYIWTSNIVYSMQIYVTHKNATYYIRTSHVTTWHVNEACHVPHTRSVTYHTPYLSSICHVSHTLSLTYHTPYPTSQVTFSDAVSEAQSESSKVSFIMFQWKDTFELWLRALTWSGHVYIRLIDECRRYLTCYLTAIWHDTTWITTQVVNESRHVNESCVWSHVPRTALNLNDMCLLPRCVSFTHR